MANALAVTLHALGAESASGTGTAVDIGSTRSALSLVLRVTAITGELSVLVQTSPDGTTGWRDVAGFDKVSVESLSELCSDELERYVRAKWTLTGDGAAATFSVAGNAHQLYATRRHLALTLPKGLLADTDSTIIAHALISGSCDCEDALNGAYKLPITSWPDTLSQRAAEIASLTIATQNGFAGGGVDDFVRDAAIAARAWLRRIADGKLRPPGIVDSEPEVVESSAYVITNTKRGW